MGKIIKIIFILLLVVLIGGVGVLGYLGFLPGVSKLLGTDKPRDLGMRYSQEAYDNGLKKAGVEVVNLPVNSVNTISYEGSHEVMDIFTDEEMTSHASNKDWVDYPISDVQIRINDDNTMEVSGILSIEKFGAYLEKMGVSQAQYKMALEQVRIPIKNVPFYAKGLGTASNNTLDLNMTAFEVGRFPVPQKYIDQYWPQAVSLGEKIMRGIGGFSVNEAKMENGKLYFDGSLPDKEMLVP